MLKLVVKMMMMLVMLMLQLLVLGSVVLHPLETNAGATRLRAKTSTEEWRWCRSEAEQKPQRPASAELKLHQREKPQQAARDTHKRRSRAEHKRRSRSDPPVQR